MNIAHLRTFVAVAETGTLSEAARALSLPQPAVTQQLGSLESEIGVTLLDRRYREADLTEAGRALLPHARAILAQVEEALGEVGGLAGTVTGRVTIAASTTPGQYILPRMLGGFLEENPEVGVEVRVGDTAEVVEAVEEGRAHIGVTGARVDGSKAVYEPFIDDELVLIAPPGHPLAAGGPHPAAELAGARWVMRERGSGTRMVLEKVLCENGVEPSDLQVALELGTGEALVSAVQGGMGLGVVSRYVADRAIAAGDVAEVATDHFPVSRPLFVVAPRGDLSGASQALLALLRTHATGKAEG